MKQILRTPIRTTKVVEITSPLACEGAVILTQRKGAEVTLAIRQGSRIKRGESVPERNKVFADETRSQMSAGCCRSRRAAIWR